MSFGCAACSSQSKNASITACASASNLARFCSRVCFIVGAHHTKEKVDGIDFQVIWEADFIVNIEEKNLVFKDEELPAAIEENVSTPTGKRLVSEAVARMFPGGV